MHGSGASGRDFTMSTGSQESQYGLRHVNGEPVWNGDMLTARDYETAALWYRAGLKPGKQDRAVARLWAALQRPAKEVVRACRRQDCEDARGAERLFRILRESPLAAMPVPDANKKIQAYDQIRRRPTEVLGDYIVREKRAFRERGEKDGTHRRQHHTSPGNSRGGRRGRKHQSIVATAKFRSRSSNWRFGVTIYYRVVVTHLRSAWGDQDVLDRDRGGGGKGFGKSSRTVHCADADREWHAEQVSHIISCEGAEVRMCRPICRVKMICVTERWIWNFQGGFVTPTWINLSRHHILSGQSIL